MSRIFSFSDGKGDDILLALKVKTLKKWKNRTVWKLSVFGVFLVCISLIRAECGPEKLPKRTLFTQCSKCSDMGSEILTIKLEKCPNTEFFLVSIFPQLDWIWRDAGKYGPEKTSYLDTFHAVTSVDIKLISSHKSNKFLITESPLKMMKNAFYFTLKALIVLKIFKFLSWLFVIYKKRLD